MKKILNLTQHQATQEQKAAGVYDLQGEDLKKLKELLTFDTLPTMIQVKFRAYQLAELAYEKKEADCNIDVMIGGAPFLMYPLIKALSNLGLNAVFAFSEREVVEEPQPDGSVKKTSIFKHKGFVEAW